jgi:hypothetical protein
VLARPNSPLLLGLFAAGMDSGESVLRTFSCTRGAGDRDRRLIWLPSKALSFDGDDDVLLSRAAGSSFAAADFLISLFSVNLVNSPKASLLCDANVKKYSSIAKISALSTVLTLTVLAPSTKGARATSMTLRKGSEILTLSPSLWLRKITL